MVIEGSGAGVNHQTDQLLKQIAKGLHLAPTVKRCMMLVHFNRVSQWEELAPSMLEAAAKQGHEFQPHIFARIADTQYSIADRKVLAVQLIKERTILVPNSGSVLVSERSNVCWIGGSFLSIEQAKGVEFSGRSAYAWAKGMSKVDPVRVVKAANGYYYSCGAEDTAVPFGR